MTNGTKLSLGYQHRYLFSSAAIFAFGKKYIDAILKDSDVGISVITEIELLCWKASTEKDLEIIQQFVADAQVFELEYAIKKETAAIRRAQKIKLPDAIIAATAIQHNLTLLTRNTRDFSGIAGLKIVNPFEQ